jgi:hypothetical protein
MLLGVDKRSTLEHGHDGFYVVSILKLFRCAAGIKQNAWTDVTYTVRVLLSRNGMVRVNNQNMGGDPAVGADKTQEGYFFSDLDSS